jgi:hypothetical protein
MVKNEERGLIKVQTSLEVFFERWDVELVHGISFGLETAEFRSSLHVVTEVVPIKGVLILAQRLDKVSFLMLYILSESFHESHRNT